MRDPVARFVSAWDFQWQGKTPRDEVLDRWPTIEALALDIHDAYPDIDRILGYSFRPQVWWVESADLVRERCVWVGRTETLDADFVRLREVLGLSDSHQLPRRGTSERNATDRRSSLSRGAEAAVRDFYATDHALIEELWPRQE